MLSLVLIPPAYGDGKHIVFNMTGSFLGYGDVTGPLWTVIKMKKSHPENRFTLIVDARATQVVREMYAGRPLVEIARELNLQFMDVAEAKNLPEQSPSDYSFEPFFGGRRIHRTTGEPSHDDFTNTVFNSRSTVTIVSDTMHGHSF